MKRAVDAIRNSGASSSLNLGGDTPAAAATTPIVNAATPSRSRAAAAQARQMPTPASVQPVRTQSLAKTAASASAAKGTASKVNLGSA
jgi:hypothetical protein